MRLRLVLDIPPFWPRFLCLLLGTNLPEPDFGIMLLAKSANSDMATWKANWVLPRILSVADNGCRARDAIALFGYQRKSGSERESDGSPVLLGSLRRWFPALPTAVVDPDPKTAMMAGVSGSIRALWERRGVSGNGGADLRLSDQLRSRTGALHWSASRRQYGPTERAATDRFPRRRNASTFIE